MIILGLDPGLATVGLGILSVEGSKFRHLYHGTIRTSPSDSLSQRLLKISNSLESSILEFKPNLASIEKLFFNSNKSTAIDVAQARGVLILTLSHHHMPIFEYTPIQVKSAVCGYGRADKRQVQFMVQKLLNLPKLPKPDDAADGLALSICHANSYRLHSKV